MENKLTIAGMQFDNLTVKESLRVLEKAAADRAFFSVEEIDADMILRGATDERTRRAITMFSHTVIADEAILKAVGENSPMLMREIADRSFFYEVMRSIERDGVTVCLLADTEQHADEAKKFLGQLFPDIKLVEVEILETCTGELDNLINEINARTQDVVISILPSPLQEYFFLNYREKLSACFWYGMGPLPKAHTRSRIATFLSQRKKIRALCKLMAQESS